MNDSLAKSVLQDIAREQDWSVKEQLNFVLDFIDDNNLVDELEAFLEELKEEHNEIEGTEEDDEED